MCMPPAVRLENLKLPVICVEMELSAAMEPSPLVPFPNWPAEFDPQQYAVPLMLNAQVCRSPAAIFAYFLSPPTAVGLDRSEVVPSPS